MGFRYLEHTADLRAVIEAGSFVSLLQAAADLVRDITVGRSPVRADLARDMDLDGSGEPERLFRFVRELVYRFDVEAFVPAQVESAGLGDGRVRVLGETFDPARHTPEHQVKALTRHGYRFDRRDGVLEAELVFDL